ncbi:MAG: sensor histidine kinase [Kiritimatiellae bacterium]|nr:sensor histidine kinase [Kiritimatiellia bacterium]
MKTSLSIAVLATAAFASWISTGAETARPATAADVLSGGLEHELVKVSGIVSSVTWDEMNAGKNWFALRTPSGVVYASVKESEYPLGKLFRLTDAEVEVTALVASQNRWQRFSGAFLLPHGKDAIKTTKPPPATAPEFTLDPSDAESFAKHARTGEFAHRVRLGGLLLTECSSSAFLMTEGGHIVKLTLLAGSKAPKCGVMVSATGFVTYDCGGLVMHDVAISPAPDAPLLDTPKPWSTTLNGAHSRARHANGFSRRVVSFTAEVAIPPEVMHRGPALWLRSEGNYAAVDVSSHYEDMRRERVDTVMRVTGVCDPVFETDPVLASFPKFKGITIVPMPEDGVVVISKSIWSYKMLAAVSIHLLILVAIITVALVVQRILYNRRGRQLFEERAANVRNKAKVEERTRLAAELHDAVSQALTGVALQIESAEVANMVGETDGVAKLLGSASQILTSCRRELKDCLWDLRSRTFAEKDMNEAVNRTITPHTGDAKAVVRFNVQRSRLSESTTHTVLSVVRELVVNAVRHGDAAHVWIAGECSDGRISFSVRDDGCGFDPAAAPGPSEGHFGLQGIRERIKAVKGTIEIESAPGRGTKATIRIPEET